MLEKFRMSDCKPVKTPMDPNKKWITEMSTSKKESQEDFPYSKAIGSLLYLEPNIAPRYHVCSRCCK